MPSLDVASSAGQRQHGREHEGAAQELQGPERLPEDEEGEENRHERFHGGKNRRGGRPDPPQAGEEGPEPSQPVRAAGITPTPVVPDSLASPGGGN